MELYPGYLEDHFSMHKLSAPGRYMTSASATQFAASPGPMGIYGRRHQLPLAAGVWGDPFRPDSNAQAAATMPMESTEAKFDDRVQDVDVPVQEALRSSPDSFDQQGTRPEDKIRRRLAQNREAARKSRLRKKAYVQNLETSRMKLAHLEQELNRARQQGVYISGSSPAGLSGPLDAGVAAFEMEYARWVEEQGKQTGELRSALQAHASEIQLQILVEAGLAHYERLFQAKSIAAKSDVFFVMFGMWRTPVEHIFLWIGGFRPSELLKILGPQLEPLTEQQATAVNMLQHTARQAEDALSQGMEKLKQTLAESLTTVVVAQGSDASFDAAAGYYTGQMASAMGSLDALAGFVDQADHLRQQTLQNMYKILTARQAARGLLALGDYCQRLRALNSLWAARPREPA